MNVKTENELLTIVLPERVDTNSVDGVAAEIDTILAEYSDKQLILDAAELTYISSAGLRMILKLRKRFPELAVLNTSSEVYDIFDMTGFTEMLRVEKAYRQLSVDGCPIIGRGAKGIVYRYNDDTIVKVYKDNDSLPSIKRERELARKAFVLGIPTAISYDIVKVGDRYGSVFELLEAKSYTQAIAQEENNREHYILEMADLLRQIHSTKVDRNDMPSAEKMLSRWVNGCQSLLPTESAEKLSRLAAEIPDTDTMLHCDFHTNNIMLQKGETLLIDMDTLCHGHPIIELANVHCAYIALGEVLPNIIEDFLGIPCPLAAEIWNTFLPRYLNTNDPAKIAEIEKKIEVLSYARTLRHFAGRLDIGGDSFKQAIAHYQNKLVSLLDQVDSLLF